MLVELAIGDAYGAGFEFKDEQFVRAHNDLTRYYPHELNNETGVYTDDTQMSIALAELLLSGDSWNHENVASAFVRCYKRDPRLGYAKGFQSFLDEVGSGAEFLEKINPSSTRNGACMRSAPLGVIYDTSKLLDYAEIQAKVTHDTKEGIVSAQAIALCAQFFLYEKGESSELIDYVREHTQYRWSGVWEKSVPCSAMETVEAVLCVLTKCKDLRSIILASVDFTGDVDTVAALCCAIASQSKIYSNNLPALLYRDLENGSYGLEFLEKLWKRLVAQMYS